MAKTGEAWLGLTKEQTLEPELPICDPHHHLWDRRGSMAPYQRYLLDEFLRDAGYGHNVRSTVFVEADSMLRAAGPKELKSVGEVEFVQGVAAASASGIYGESRIAAAIVGTANLNLGENVKPVLETLQAASPNRFRGIRHRLAWDPHKDPGVRGQLQLESFRIGSRVLASMGLSFEAWLYYHQLLDLAHFANALPDLAIVLNHIGGLVRIGAYAGKDDEVIPAWKEGIAAVASCPNVVVKLGGMGMPIMGFDWHQRDIPVNSEELANEMAPFMEYCIEQFGPEKCLFESNFPVDKVSYSYNVMYNAFKRLSRPYSPGERAAMFHDNAVRVYRITGD